MEKELSATSLSGRAHPNPTVTYLGQEVLKAQKNQVFALLVCRQELYHSSASAHEEQAVGAAVGQTARCTRNMESSDKQKHGYFNICWLRRPHCNSH